MALRKNPKVDLKLHYKKAIEISVIIALALVIAAFRVFPKFENPETIFEAPQDTINLEDVEITKQDATPPPPPKPPIIIEAPLDNELVDLEIFDTGLNPYENVTLQPTIPPIVDPNIEVNAPFFEVVEELPSPIGGIESIYKNLEYPEPAKKIGIEGVVKIFAYVDKNGDVVKAELIKGIGIGCDEEAMKAISLLKFNPGKQRGKPVNVRVAMSIKFVLK